MYKFTTRLANNVCRNCGDHIPRSYSSGGVGAVCQKCAPLRDDFDLVEMGVVRNIAPTENGSFTFQANIDGKWYNCSLPCGNWAYVDNGLAFSVPVGWWELEELYNKYQTV